MFKFWQKRKRAVSHNNSVLTDWDRKFMAYHEAGHAVCSRFLPEREKILLITIDPSADGFGMIQTAPRPHHNETRSSFLSAISTFLAGRLAEEMFLGAITTSCIYDFSSAQSIAASMVTTFGMGKTLGLTVVKSSDHVTLSEHHRERICADIQQILQEAENDARHTLDTHRSVVISLAELLLKQKTLHENEISAFFNQNLGRQDE